MRKYKILASTLLLLATQPTFAGALLSLESCTKTLFKKEPNEVLFKGWFKRFSEISEMDQKQKIDRLQELRLLTHQITGVINNRPIQEINSTLTIILMDHSERDGQFHFLNDRQREDLIALLKKKGISYNLWDKEKDLETPPIWGLTKYIAQFETILGQLTESAKGNEESKAAKAFDKLIRLEQSFLSLSPSFLDLIKDDYTLLVGGPLNGLEIPKEFPTKSLLNLDVAVEIEELSPGALASRRRALESKIFAADFLLQKRRRGELGFYIGEESALSETFYRKDTPINYIEKELADLRERLSLLPPSAGLYKGRLLSTNLNGELLIETDEGQKLLFSLWYTRYRGIAVHPNLSPYNLPLREVSIKIIQSDSVRAD